MRSDLAVVLCGLCAAAAYAEERFPFVIAGDDASASATDMSKLSPGPAGADGFVTMRDGHFFTKSGRLRIWGVNTCFGADFPSHEEAEKVAAHLAKIGINGVRFHHHDMFGAPGGIWAKTVDGKRTLDPGQLDKQDYFLDQLHKRGVYANLNLHVSRTFNEEEGFVSQGLPGQATFDKFLLYYEPKMRELFKLFCRMYLTHENPYRSNLRRADDPGIAVIEITNENAFSTEGARVASMMPEPYRGEFKRQWNEWLKKRYGTTEALRKAWRDASEPLGDYLARGDWTEKLEPWRLRKDPGFEVNALPNQPGPAPDVKALKLDIIQKVGEVWRQELSVNDLSVEEGKLYTLSFWVRADGPRTVFLDVSNQGPDNWRSLGYEETIKLTAEWMRIERVFRAKETIEKNARIVFKFGGTDADLYLAQLQFRRGGKLLVLPQDQSIEQANIEIPVAGWVDEAQQDVRTFMVEVETGFIKEIVAFLKDELKVKVPVTASQITYHGPKIVAETCDYADIHSYWEHPSFPGRAWDGNNWTIGNTPMERSPRSDAMLSLAPWRLLDRPFTVSEWNIATPNDFAASTAPFAAMAAALQDWDGVFFFDYHSSDKNWFADRLMGYFSFNGHPAKLAMLSACANMFRRGDLKPLADAAAGTFDKRLPSALALSCRIGIDPKAETPGDRKLPEGKRLATPDGSVVWDATDPAKAHVTVNSPASRAVWGLVANQSFELGTLKIAVGPTFRDYAAMVVTSLDGKPLEQSSRMLLTAVGTAENQNMGWDEKRTTVGSRWGTGPTQVNGIPAKLSLASPIKAIHALDGRGARVATVPVKVEGGTASWEVSAEHKTLWYEIVVGE